MDLGLAGKSAIVCASSRGLGRACAVALAREGVRVVVNGRDTAQVEATRALIADAGGDVVAVVADLGTSDGQDALLAACPDPDILVNNNGGPPRSKFHEVSREEIMRGVAMNMITPIEMIQRVIGGMQARGFGRIVNITSINVKMPVPFLEVSAAARSGLTAYVASVSRQVIGQGVTMNNILPGFFDTDRQKEAFRTLSGYSGRPVEELRAERLATVPAGRFGEPDELGHLCAFLCSAGAGYLTNQNIVIDGARYESTL